MVFPSRLRPSIYIATQPENRRRAFLAAIEAEPGIRLRELTRRTGLAYNVVIHHVGALCRAKLVERVRRGNALHFFPSFTAAADRHAMMVLQQTGLEPLLAWLRRSGPAAQFEAVAAMRSLHDWPRSTTQHRLGRLVREGLVDVGRNGRRCAYAALPRLGSAGHHPSKCRASGEPAEPGPTSSPPMPRLAVGSQASERSTAAHSNPLFLEHPQRPTAP